MKFNQKELIEELIDISNANTKAVFWFKRLNDRKLNLKPNEYAWSILECIEHLNLYFDYYIPVIRASIEQSSSKPKEDTFKAGVLGNYFTNIIKWSPKMSKMSSPKDKTPSTHDLSPEVLNRFITSNEELIRLLDVAKEVNLTKTKTPISISTWIKLRLGDTLRFVIYHNERHITQAQQVLSK